MENNIEVPQNIKNKITMIQQFHFWVEYISKGNKISILKRHLHPHVYWNIIYDSQDVETT